MTQFRILMIGPHGERDYVDHIFDSLTYLKSAEREFSRPSLFDFEDVPKAA